MEFLDRIGDFFVAFTAQIERLITWLFGASNERSIRRLGFERRGLDTRIVSGSPLDRINQLEPSLQQLTDDELKQTASRLRARLAQGETLDELMVDAFAAVRESGRRYLRMRHYDVQMIGGYFLHRGMIAEMVTGEGKTLVATLPAFLNALPGKVHVVTVNDYLARRDMEWMAPLYMGLGLSVGAIQSHMDPQDKIQAYQCDITYGTNNEFGFDYLRDNMKPSAQLQVQGPLNFAIVDEIDNILIDEARTPLIISGPAEDDVDKYRRANTVAAQLQKDLHFEIKEKEHTCHLTEEGVRHAEELAGVESFYTAGNMEWPHLIDNALRAHHLYKRDVQYVVMGGEVIIVDEFTGRLMKGRQWSDGLHQAVEAKERVPVKEENQTLATITLQNYFKLYKKLGGMTGTAMTEANEFWKIYKLDVVTIPTNRPLSRINSPDVVFRSQREKYHAVVDEIRSIHDEGRPILVGTTSIEKSELISERLKQFGIRHEVLNAKYHEREADIIAQAGRLAAVTIATNMAGRGTDIILGGNPDQMAWDQLKLKYKSRLDVPKSEWDELASKIATEEGMAAEGRKVAELGGLHVIGTERHEARRIDLQLRGRSGRQGDPGSSRFFLSLEDDLMRIFGGEWVRDLLTRLGMQEGEAIESGLVTRRIEAAQKKVEERHFEQRKNLLEYDEVMDQQRKRVYTYRQNVLDGVDTRQLILDMIREQITAAVTDLLSASYPRKTCVQWAAFERGIEVTESDVRDSDPDLVIETLTTAAVNQADDLIRDRMEEDLPQDVDDPREWNWGALSRWANLRWSLNTSDRELKKMSRDEVYDYLLERARESVERADFSAIRGIMAEDYGRQSLSQWLERVLTVNRPPKEFENKTPDEVVPLIMADVERLYDQKEIDFPVAVGLSRFLATTGSGERYDREGLVRWANSRFQTQLETSDVQGKPREEVRSLLRRYSEQFHPNGEMSPRLEQFLDKAYGARNGDEHTAPPQDPAPLQELVTWAHTEWKSTLQVEDLQPLPRDAARQKLLNEVEARYRPELREAERQLVLDILDSAWKDHLYVMDHLRQGIGLVGYAQKDPKVEYKREGMRAFDAMWKRIGEQVTGSIFRMEEFNPDFVGSLWRITGEIHEEAVPAAYEVVEGANDGAGPSPANDPADQPVEPIRNLGNRVGRNDPCPCGSGKKFKNCHMRR